VNTLAEKILALHRSLSAANLPHAFGGALALAWCTKQPRGTSDIDVNVFVPTSAVQRVLEALPPEVIQGKEDAKRLQRDGQARLRWNTTPIDVFLNVSAFHEAVMQRLSYEPFEGETVPFLACEDLAVFKAFLDRRRDWADIEDMLRAGALDVDVIARSLAEHVGADDERVAKLRSLEEEMRS
jgi:hypothetical protein